LGSEGDGLAVVDEIEFEDAAFDGVAVEVAEVEAGAAWGIEEGEG
jgi:hypothetical protein